MIMPKKKVLKVCVSHFFLQIPFIEINFFFLLKKHFDGKLMIHFARKLNHFYG